MTSNSFPLEVLFVGGPLDGTLRLIPSDQNHISSYVVKHMTAYWYIATDPPPIDAMPTVETITYRRAFFDFFGISYPLFIPSGPSYPTISEVGAANVKAGNWFYHHHPANGYINPTAWAAPTIYEADVPLLEWERDMAEQLGLCD